MAPSMAQVLTLPNVSTSYLVGIRSSANSTNECAGVLIAKNFVLSANCQPNWANWSGGALNSNDDMQYASIGSRYNSGERDGERIKINWTLHPDFNSTTGEFNSILLTLATKSTYEPIALPVYTGLLPLLAGTPLP